MKNVCITGVSGYLGMRLLNELSANEAIGSIVGVDIVPPSKGSEKMSFHKMDIRDSRIGELLSGQNIDTVLHLAFVVKPIHDRKLMYDVDFNGTRNILDKACAAGVKHLIAVSSTLAYGAHKDNLHELKETDPLRGNKIFPYGHNKALVDEMIQGLATEHPEMIITILRPCTVLGPNVDNYVSRMLFRPLAVSVLGYNAKVQFLHEDDFVKACLKAMERQVPGAFNIAGEGTLTTREVAHMIGTKLIPLPSWILSPFLELLWRLHFPGIEVNRGYLDYVRYAFVAGTEKARKGMDFCPEYSSFETIQDTVVRKNTYPSFPFPANIRTAVLLMLLFCLGFLISLRWNALGAATYVVLWGISYVIIYAGTCRNCVYYGKRCPIPLEGSCVHRFFERGGNRFGYLSIVWAGLAYLFRICIPLLIIINDQWLMGGIAYFGLFALFWANHLVFAGCPNCINTDCPLNPDYAKR